MSTGKTSIFITVLAFHASVLAIVFLTTRPEPQTILPKDLDPVATNSLADDSKITHIKKKEYLTHTVGNNEYLGQIAAKYKVSTQDIINLNNIKNPNHIAKGMHLKISLK